MPAAEPPRPGSNSDLRETALLEALWRGDELAAALNRVHEELAATRRRLADAEEIVAELSETGEAAQAAIDALRVRVGIAEAKAELYEGQREALAAELFRLSRAGAPEAPAAADAADAGRGPRRSFRRRIAARFRAFFAR